MRRIHIPNLFFIQGQSYQGKSSLARHFRQSLDCETLQTDQIFWRWCDKYHPKETRNARASLGRYFPYLPAPLRREWFEYLVNYTIAVTKYAKPDMVIEGWLLTLLPRDLKEVLHSRCTIMNVTMRHYAAHTAKKTFKPDGSDYTQVVAALKHRMQLEREASLMPRVKYQRFEDCKHCAGRSSSLERLAAFELPTDLTGKRILEIDCMTGYNAIRLAQRGAKLHAVDMYDEYVRLASRIANSIYRLPQIRFYHGDILTEDFRKPVLFDYVLAMNGTVATKDHARLFQRAHELLVPGGKFLVEMTTQRLDQVSPDYDKYPFFKEVKLKSQLVNCPNEKTVQSWAGGFALETRTRSATPANSTLNRIAYTFTKQGDYVPPCTVPIEAPRSLFEELDEQETTCLTTCAN